MSLSLGACVCMRARVRACVRMFGLGVVVVVVVVEVCVCVCLCVFQYKNYQQGMLQVSELGLVCLFAGHTRLKLPLQLLSQGTIFLPHGHSSRVTPRYFNLYVAYFFDGVTYAHFHHSRGEHCGTQNDLCVRMCGLGVVVVVIEVCVCVCLCVF